MKKKKFGYIKQLQPIIVIMVYVIIWIMLSDLPRLDPFV
jgi:hypothetical protein